MGENGRTDGRTDRRTILIALCFQLTRWVITEERQAIAVIAAIDKILLTYQPTTLEQNGHLAIT